VLPLLSGQGLPPCKARRSGVALPTDGQYLAQHRPSGSQYTANPAPQLAGANGRAPGHWWAYRMPSDHLHTRRVSPAGSKRVPPGYSLCRLHRSSQSSHHDAHVFFFPEWVNSKRLVSYLPCLKKGGAYYRPPPLPFWSYLELSTVGPSAQAFLQRLGVSTCFVITANPCPASTKL
jgi:hypothetical protein